ncbi:MAG: nucleotidyltransferase domain-containing protein [Chloroflexota bacterium]
MSTTAADPRQDVFAEIHDLFGDLFDPGFDERMDAWMPPLADFREPRDPPPPPETVIGEMVDLIVARHHPLAILLFGSRACGTGRPGSDIDLLVVLDTVADKRAAAADIRGDLYWSEYPKDIIVTCPDEIAAERDDRTSFITALLKTGKSLYDRRG